MIINLSYSSQIFYIHNANEFPSLNPTILNKDQPGNGIPHRLLLKGREEYELMEWYINKEDKSQLNVSDWTKYIQKVKKLRDNEDIGQQRKIIQLTQIGTMELEKKQGSVNIQTNLTNQPDAEERLFELIEQQEQSEYILSQELELQLQIKEKSNQSNSNQQSSQIQESPEIIEIQKEEFVNKINTKVNSKQISNVQYEILSAYSPKGAPEIQYERPFKSQFTIESELEKGYVYMTKEQINNLDIENINQKLLHLSNIQSHWIIHIMSLQLISQYVLQDNGGILKKYHKLNYIQLNVIQLGILWNSQKVKLKYHKIKPNYGIKE